ncbi:MAG: hypothetical protein AUG84_00805 [Chloroflexi bacterium 13_1_20CM_4_66_7]|nr:MAG: hypothetical protein AUG84_00805 [Chloroflexi bacterium 13_1_20CM_4_66_7]
MRTPFVDVKTGLISREWYLFLQAMFNRVGGASGSLISITAGDGLAASPNPIIATGAIRLANRFADSLLLMGA